MGSKEPVHALGINPGSTASGPTNCLGPASSDVTDFVDSIREASPFLESGWGMGWGEGGGVENSRERELGLLCKIPSKQLF